jgi:hypothetical protein
MHVPLQRKKKYSKLKHKVVCSWRGHILIPVEMNEEAHKAVYLQRYIGDLYECACCHGRTYRLSVVGKQ